MATNQVTGSGNHAELLTALTDEQLDEQIKYFSDMETWYRNTPDQSAPINIYTSHSYAAWKISNLRSTAVRERTKRR